MRAASRNVAVVAATVLAGALGTGVARGSAPSAVTSAEGARAPSACRPANHTATITAGPATAGRRHYRVTLTAAPGYEPCQLAGSPTDVRFYSHGSLKGVSAGHYGPQKAVATFGPGHQVHFDIQVLSGGPGVAADEATFILKAPDGVIPGESSAHGSFVVGAGAGAGAVIGPVRSGA